MVYREDFLASLTALAGKAYENYPMSRCTTMKTGGNADIYIIPNSSQALMKCIGLCREHNIPYYVIGNGSNLLVSDKGVRGVVLATAGLDRLSCNGRSIEAGSGVLLSRIASLALANDLAGFEFAAGIPGSLGGAVVMNAGAYGGEMKNVISFVHAYVMDEGKTVDVENCHFSYRNSIFDENKAIVLGATISLSKGNHEEIACKMKEYAIARREKQPLEYPSSGSIFKRPPGHFAGALIEQAGLGGFAIGGAQVSEKHCGFIINIGGATTQDVLSLMAYIEEKVEAQAGVKLQPEVRVVGEF